MSTPTSDKYEQFDQIAEEFAERFRRGERPALHEYTQRYPELASEIRDLFPALVEIERVEVRPEAPPPLRQVGDYRVLREIGRGGMGVVYEAEQASLGRRVALKVLHTCGDANAVERFKREARAAAKLHHTNIVPVFEVGESTDVIFYAMQHIQGQGLDQVIAELRRLRSTGDRRMQPGKQTSEPTANLPAEAIARSILTARFASADSTDATLAPRMPAPPTETVQRGSPSSAVLPGQTDLAAAGEDHSHFFESVARIGHQTAGALAHAHERGIVHRDVKPSNLLLDTSGTVWVTDFGLAKTEDRDLTNPGDIIGTLRYMAPERFHGCSDPRVDIYALGVTLYELLVLQPAFKSCDRLTLMSEISLDEPARPRSLDQRIPRDLETIVLKAMAKDPTRRYQTAAAMSEDLRRYLAGEPILARRTSAIERTRLWCRRHKALAGLYVVLGIAAVGASLAAIYLNHLLGESEEQRGRIAQAERQGKDELWKSYLAQARATRMTQQPGQRYGALEAIRAALKLPVPADHTAAELRDEAIAALCLPDIVVAKEWDGYPTGSSAFAIDTPFERYARADSKGNVSIRRISDDKELMSIRGEGTCSDYDGLVFSPDGRLLRVALPQKQILWRIDVDPPVRKAVFDVAEFSPDGKLLATWDATGTIRILDSESLREVRRFDAIMPKAKMIWNPTNGRQLMAFNERSYRLLDQETGSAGPLVEMPSGFSPTWHPDGSNVVTSAADLSIRTWQLQRQTWGSTVLEGHRASGIIMGFNHFGDLLVSSDWGGLWRVWSPRTGQQLLSLPADGHTLQFSPDDEQLAAHTGSKKVRLFRVASGKEFASLTRPKGAKGSGYFDQGKVPISGDGRICAVQTDQGVVLLDVERCEEASIISLPGETPLSFESSTGALLTNGRFGLLRWPIRTKGSDVIQVEIGPPEVLHRPPSGQLSRSADGSVTAVGFATGAYIWHEKNNRRLVTSGWQSNVRFCDVSPDGRWVATGSGELYEGAGAKVWDAATGKLVAEFPVGRMCRVWFSPDGKWLLTGAGGYRLWEVGSWRQRHALGGSDQGDSSAFTQDGGLLALCDKPGVVLLVEPGTGREVAKLTAPVSTRIWPKCFTPDGSKLIVLGTDTRSLHIFNLQLINAQLRDLDLSFDAPETAISPAVTRPPHPIAVTIEMGSLTLNQDVNALLAQAAALGDAKKYAQAIDVLRRAAKADPKRADAHNNLAWMLLTCPEDLRDPTEALPHAELADKLSGGKAVFKNTFGVALYRNCKYEDAVPVLEASLKASKGQQDAFDLFFLAMCHQQLGDAAKANNCFDRAERWLQEKRGKLPTAWIQELDAFQAEAKAVLQRPKELTNPK
jgi:eukaryotic-like serine/threonine-protein kinase